MLRKLLKSAKGFTLVELMVVVLIIAILVAIAIPVYNAASTSAKNKSCRASLRTLDGAIQTYRADNDGSDVPPLTWKTTLAPSYVQAIPTCSWEGNDGCYEITGAGASQQMNCNDGTCDGQATGAGAASCEYR